MQYIHGKKEFIRVLAALVLREICRQIQLLTIHSMASQENMKNLEMYSSEQNGQHRK